MLFDSAYYLSRLLSHLPIFDVVLRALQESRIQRVGSDKDIKVNVRVVAATNKDLKKEIEDKKFREDLYFRLNTVSIQVPPLRERGDDIELLFNYFALEFGEKYKRDPIMLEEAIKSLCPWHALL